MTPETALLVVVALVAVLTLIGYAVFHRLTNSRGQVTWDIRTVEPDASILRVERDDARREAERLRDELRQVDTVPPPKSM